MCVAVANLSFFMFLSAFRFEDCFRTHSSPSISCIYWQSNLLTSFGSARAVNRRYISDCVPLRLRMQASTGFVSASALGMACGPALASLLQTNFKIYKLTFNQDTLPGWLMDFAWLIYLVWLWISFKEPVRETEVNNVPQESNADALEKGVVEPLLLKSPENQQDEDEEDSDESEEASKESHQPVNSIAAAYRLLTPSVKVHWNYELGLQVVQSPAYSMNVPWWNLSWDYQLGKNVWRLQWKSLS